MQPHAAVLFLFIFVFSLFYFISEFTWMIWSTKVIIGWNKSGIFIIHIISLFIALKHLSFY